MVTHESSKVVYFVSGLVGNVLDDACATGQLPLSQYRHGFLRQHRRSSFCRHFDEVIIDCKVQYTA